MDVERVSEAADWVSAMDFDTVSHCKPVAWAHLPCMMAMRNSKIVQTKIVEAQLHHFPALE